MLPLPPLDCHPSSSLSILSLAVTPGDPRTLGGEDSCVSPFPLRQRLCDHIADSVDQPAASPYQGEKMEPTSRNQFRIADLFTYPKRCLEFLLGLFELARQQEAVP